MNPPVTVGGDRFQRADYRALRRTLRSPLFCAIFSGVFWTGGGRGLACFSSLSITRLDGSEKMAAYTAAV